MAMDPITAGEELGGKLVDLVSKWVPDKDLATKLAYDLKDKMLSGELAASADQREIDKVEAASAHWFVAAARPALLWICDLAIFFYYIPYIIAATCFWAHQVWTTGALQPRPDLGIGDILGLVATLLGSATLRTVDKKLGVATKQINWSTALK
jgi:Holin of 3TMs, for gene-transfer release